MKAVVRCSTNWQDEIDFQLKGQGFSDISHSNISFEVDDEYSVTGAKVRNIQLRREQIETVGR